MARFWWSDIYGSSADVIWFSAQRCPRIRANEPVQALQLGSIIQRNLLFGYMLPRIVGYCGEGERIVLLAYKFSHRKLEIYDSKNYA